MRTSVKPLNAWKKNTREAILAEHCSVGEGTAPGEHWRDKPKSEEKFQFRSEYQEKPHRTLMELTIHGFF